MRSYPARAIARSTAAALTALLLLAGCAGTPEPRPQAQASAETQPQAGAMDDALALLRAGRYREAADAWKTLAAAHPQDAAALANLAIAYMELGRQQEAEAALEQALSIDPAQPAAATMMAIRQRKAGRFEEARASYQRVLDAHPDYALAHLNLGVLCDLYLQEPRCARAHYQRYQALRDGGEEEVAQWVADLDRRLDE